MEGPGALGLVLAPVGKIVGRGGPGWVPPGPGLEGGLLIHAEAHFILMERARIEVEELSHRGIERRVTGLLGVEPEMLAPGLERVRAQHPSPCRRREVRDDPLGNELARQFAAVPLGEAAPQSIGALAGQAHQVDRHRGGKKSLWRRGRGRP